MRRTGRPSTLVHREGLDELGWIGARVHITFEDLPECFGLVFACDEKDDGPRRVYDGDGERDAGGIQPGHWVRIDPSVVDLEGLRLGEQARRVAVGPDAE